MNHSILAENYNSRKEIPMWQLLCFVTFCIWQMGFIYFMGPSLNIDGRTPLPVSMDNITLLIVIGYVCSIIVMCFIPVWVIRLSRMSTVMALVMAIGLFFPFGTQVLTALIYIHCFCCFFMIGFETATMLYYFSEKSVMKHLLIAYPIAYSVICVIQNDFIKISFSVFRILTVIILILLLLFFCKMPTKTCPRFVNKEDNLVIPKKFLFGVFLLSFLSSLLGVVGPAVAAECSHGVAVLYIGCAIFSFAVILVYKIRGIHPIHLMPFVIGVAVVGYILLLISHHVPAVALFSCFFIGAGMTACSLVPLLGILMSKQYPSKFIAPVIIGLAMLAVIVHSMVVEIFRSSVDLLNLTYLVMVVVLALVYLLVEPYLLYSMRRRFNEEAAEAKDEIVQEDSAAIEEVKQDAVVSVTKNGVEITLDVLTKRELEITHFISAGYSNKDIAKILFISEHTVKDHTKNIYRKMDVHSRFELIAKVVRLEQKKD